MTTKSRKLKVSIVGAGAVATAMGVLLRKRGHKIVSVLGRNPRPARQLARLTGCRQICRHPADLSPETSFLLIATPEHTIQPLARTIAGEADLPWRTIFACHTSGALTSEALAPLVEKGARTFSFHPIHSFSAKVRTKADVKHMEGVWYGFEGKKNARTFARKLVAELKGKFLEVPKEQKVLYHLACVFASNYPVALIGALERLARGVGKGSIDPFERLLKTSAENAFRSSSAEALTGPLVRGSADVVYRHMMELKARHPELLPLYSALGLHALELLRGRKDLTEGQIAQLSSLLAGIDDR